MFINQFNYRKNVRYTLMWAIIFLLIVFSLNGCGEDNLENNGENDSEATSQVETIDGGQEILYPNSRVLRYQIGDQMTAYGYLSFNFKMTSTDMVYAQGFIDLNADGVFSEDEWLIRNQNVRVIEDFPNRFTFELPEVLQETDKVPKLNARIGLTEQVLSVKDMELVAYHEVTLTIETELLDTEFGLDVPGASEDLKRGLGFMRQSDVMDFEEISVNSDSLPDLTGGPMDCFAIATANNLINMTSQNGRRDDLPESPQDIMTELKSDMQYKDGITNANFLTGKKAFVERYDLPITTEEIKNPTINDLADAFANADAVEISTTMIRSASGHANTGHVFTGVSAYQDGDDAGLAVHDPATPEGTDTMDINMSGGDSQYIILDYPMWDGIVFVDAIFLQYWDSSSTDDSSVSLPDDTTEDVVMLPDPVLELAFEHVKPGEYSEVYAAVTGLQAGDEIAAFLYGGGHDGTRVIVEVDENGLAYFTWKITQYDDYNVTIELGPDSEMKGKITVD